MNRRDNLKLLFTGSLGAGLMMTGCDPVDKSVQGQVFTGGTPGGRTEEENLRDAKLMEGTFFTDEERKKLDTLVDIIMPADSESPSATELKVPDFHRLHDAGSAQLPDSHARWIDVAGLRSG
jgi:hypothetical protein